MDWQPIETAPRDGSAILSRNGGYYPVYVVWRDDAWRDANGTQMVPTHWMPLPPPPNEWYSLTEFTEWGPALSKKARVTK